MSKSSKLEQLKAGLGKKLAAQKPRSEVKASPDVVRGVGPNQPGGTERFTLSLHGTDLERLDALADYLRNHGVRTSNRSLLVKVALRGVELGPELIEHVKAAQAEDGRRKSGGK